MSAPWKVLDTRHGGRPGVYQTAEVRRPDGQTTLVETHGATFRGGSGQATLVDLIGGRRLRVPLDGSWAWRPISRAEAGRRSDLALPDRSDESQAHDLWWVQRRRSPILRVMLRLAKKGTLDVPRRSARGLPGRAYDGDVERFAARVEDLAGTASTLGQALAEALAERDAAPSEAARDLDRLVAEEDAHLEAHRPPAESQQQQLTLG